MDDLRHFDDLELLEGFVAEAAWFWFDASTAEKSLEAGLHRVLARCLLREIDGRRLSKPDSEIVYRKARSIFPPDDLRRRFQGAGERL